MAAEDPKKITLAEWSQRLDADSFRVAREGGTERPFTGKYWDTFDDGSYHCICCNALLFEANSKFSAHCGWPSFDKSVDGAIKYINDTTHGMVRTEVQCAGCDAHLGHVFPDGPTDTGSRYCINSVSIDLKD